ncbi:hypothetical protein [Brachybacterium saurashtrense]|uniref:hypothetical protein n=1 Tax=Brachybacterium saurashtrense TaxID=556288 RepID=UPI000F8E7A72|nr:hypothetical protein [Brachybacterium saurashtrense]
MSDRLSPEELAEIFPEGPQMRDEHYGNMLRGLPPQVREVMAEQRSWLKDVGLYGYMPTSENLDLETYKERMLKGVTQRRAAVESKKAQAERWAQKYENQQRAAALEKERRGHWKAFPLDTPVSTSESRVGSMPCRTCKTYIGDHEKTIAPREKECLECTRRAFEEVTSVKIPGGDSKRSETWKVDNLHLYLEQHSRSIAEGAKRELVIRPFTVREFVSKHGSECYSEGCTRLWSALSYSLSPAAGGSHSLENIQPACREHATEGAL